jgi:hypothetical protein
MRIRLLAALIAVLLFTQVLGCGLLKDGNFAIILTDTGEKVLTERDVASYHSDGTLDLNDKGIEKWNSYLIYRGTPKLDGTLYNRNFTINIENKEICRGKFWSNVSSASVEGIVILDSLMKLNNERHSIQIQSFYPPRGPLPESVSSRLNGFFSSRGLLK